MHRISYQSDQGVVTACGQEFLASRREIEEGQEFTLFAAYVDCPECMEATEWPIDVIRPHLGVVRSPVVADDPPDLTALVTTCARLFHEHYVKLAGSFGIDPDSSSWDELDEAGQGLLATTMMDLLTDPRTPLAVVGPVRIIAP